MPLGWLLLWRRLSRDERLLWLGYPLLLLVLLSSFKTKTPYYALQLTPFIAVAAAEALRWLSQRRARLWQLPAQLLGVALVAAGLAAPVPPAVAIPAGWLRAAALLLGACWIAASWQPAGQRRVLLWLAGPYLALVCLLQGGVFIDHSPALRRKLAEPPLAAALQQGPVHFLAATPIAGEAAKEQILLALSAPQLGQLHSGPGSVPAGVPVWQLQGNSWTLIRSWSPP